MQIGTNGIVVNEYGQILLIRRDDTRTMASPGGGLDSGELPPDSAAREVREETGLIVMPVRLVGLYFWPVRPEGSLIFSFRCIQRGGKLTPSEESPVVGFFPTSPLPGPMASSHRQRIQRSLVHDGGPPYWGTQPASLALQLAKLLLLHIIYRYKDLKRFLRRQPPYQPSPDWQTAAVVVIRNPEGKILWLKRTDSDGWHLPGGDGEKMEPPWETAVRATHLQTGHNIQLTHLTGVYTHMATDHITFTFTAQIEDDHPPVPSTESAYFAPGQEPANALPQHIEQVADAGNPNEQTIFRTVGQTVSLSSAN